MLSAALTRNRAVLLPRSPCLQVERVGNGMGTVHFFESQIHRTRGVFPFTGCHQVQLDMAARASIPFCIPRTCPQGHPDGGKCEIENARRNVPKGFHPMCAVKGPFSSIN